MKNLRPHKLLILLGSVYFIYLIGMFFIQEKMIFFPFQEVLFEIDEKIAKAEHFLVPVDKEVSLDGYFFKSEGAKKTIMFFHGNGGNITTNLGRIELFKSLGKNVVIFDYRGYGKSSGEILKESDLYNDAEIVYNYVLKEYSLKPENITLWGQSLGGAVAIEMATKYKVKNLVIESTFASVREIMLPLFRYSVPSILMKYKFDNLSKIKDLNLPILIIHSREDEMIDFRNSENLFKLASSPKQLIEITGSHNEGFHVSFQDKKEEIKNFLDK